MALRVVTALRALLAEVVDYAGLFPPAALRMDAAVRAFAADLLAPEAWMLGRFVVPVSRLEELEVAADRVLPESTAAAPWRVSTLVGEVTADLEVVAAFNRRHATGSRFVAQIDSVEIAPAGIQEIERVAALVPPTLTTYFELSLAPGLEERVAAVRAVGSRAKVRTGGTREDLFPTCEQLARFVQTCARADVPFKATAGLHHPLRGPHPVDDAPGSATAMMHGFLNLLLASVLARAGAPTADLVQLLAETRPEAFAWDDDGVTWRGRRLGVDEMGRARSAFACSFGSCSFADPTRDLAQMGLL